MALRRVLERYDLHAGGGGFLQTCGLREISLEHRRAPALELDLNLDIARLTRFLLRTLGEHVRLLLAGGSLRGQTRQARIPGSISGCLSRFFNFRTHVETWFVLLGGSALVGGLTAWYLRGASSWLAASLLPPVLFLAWLLANEYLLPYRGGGASMWPVALVIGGTAAALTSCCTLALVRLVKPRRRGS